MYQTIYKNLAVKNNHNITRARIYLRTHVYINCKVHFAKYKKITFFYQKICIYQKIFVPLYQI